MSAHIPVHTLIIGIGPDGCGKTTFLEKLRTQLAEQIGCLIEEIPIVSSKKTREILCGYPPNSFRKQELSKAAFHLLKTEIELQMQFPIRSPFVIVDTSGLSEEFRADMAKSARDNLYDCAAVVFNYRQQEEYYGNGDPDTITRQVTKLRKGVLSNLQNWTRIDVVSKSIEPTVSITNSDLYRKTMLDRTKKYLVIGDIHTCVVELKLLLERVGFEIKDNKIVDTDKTTNLGVVLVGDWVDKGSDKETVATIEFLHTNMDRLIFVLGNHEKSVSNKLTNPTPITEMTRKYFSSYLVLKDNKELTAKFQELVANTIPYAYYVSSGKGRSFIVTHSPCFPKYMGLLKKKAVDNQVYLYRDSHANVEVTMKDFIIKDNWNFPLHIMGHLTISDPYNGSRYGNNLLMIDTGCIHNNCLTGVLVGIYRPKFFSVPFQHKQKHWECVLQDMRPVVTSTRIPDVILTEDQKKRLKTLMKSKINYISGTISPAPADKKSGILESLQEGLVYYRDTLKKLGVTDMRLSIEQKYMGSRCNWYLFKSNVPRSYPVSRNGFRINGLAKDVVTRISTALMDKFTPFMEENGISMMILDGELMPWRAIGKSLIDRDFETTRVGVESELEALQEYGFEEQLAELKDKMRSSGFEADSNRITKKDLIKKYGMSEYQTYCTLQHSKYRTVEEWKKCMDVYSTQLDNFGKEDEVHYKPFGILKVVMDDDTEHLPTVWESEEFSMNQIDAYQLVSEDENCVVDLSDMDTALLRATEFQEECRSKGLEGVVLKPNYIFPGKHIAPVLKVRNEEYLTLIYGFDYQLPDKYNLLVKKKSVYKKMEMSIREFNLGVDMLNTKYSEISVDNQKYHNKLVQFVCEEEKEAELDPRL